MQHISHKYNTVVYIINEYTVLMFKNNLYAITYVRDKCDGMRLDKAHSINKRSYGQL